MSVFVMAVKVNVDLKDLNHIGQKINRLP